MNNQRGQFTLPLLGWAAVAAGVAFVGMGIALKITRSELATCKAEYQSFKATTESIALAAIARLKAEAVRQAGLRKESDDKYAKEHAALSAANKRLLDDRSRGDRVPAAPAGSKRPDLACFGRADLESALRRLDEGISGLVDEGDQNTLRLKMSREWASQALK